MGMSITDEDVIRALTRGGIALERWRLVNGQVIGYVDDKGALMGRIIEDEALTAATSRLLQERGQVHQINTVEMPVGDARLERKRMRSQRRNR